MLSRYPFIVTLIRIELGKRFEGKRAIARGNTCKMFPRPITCRPIGNVEMTSSSDPYLQTFINISTICLLDSYALKVLSVIINNNWCKRLYKQTLFWAVLKKFSIFFWLSPVCLCLDHSDIDNWQQNMTSILSVTIFNLEIVQFMAYPVIKLNWLRDYMTSGWRLCPFSMMMLVTLIA